MSSGPLVTNLLLAVIGRILVAVLLGFGISFLLTESWLWRAALTPTLAVVLYLGWLGVDRLREQRQP